MNKEILINILLKKILLSCFACALLPLSSALAEDQAEPLDIDITHTSIDSLLKMTVTSVSRIEESAWKTPAAIFVLTNEDIKKSGATSIPEALRLVPGVQVARIAADKWTVSIRGFSSGSNKLQVLIDGRSVYDLLYSGVFWESKDVMLEDVDRIEIIRGPAGTIWGANAVNGVINIITKNAKQTQGGLVTAGGGTEELGFGSARYGTQIGDSSFMRVYGKANARDSGYLKGGADDDSQFGQTGFRLDSEPGSDDKLTFQGDYYDGSQSPPNSKLVSDQQTSGGNLLFNWDHRLSADSGLNFLSYYDHTELDNPALGEIRNTGYFKLEYTSVPLTDHHLVTGVDYRYSPDHVRNTAVLALNPISRSDDRVSAFAEDTINLIKDKLSFIVGSKIEDNDYTGFEYQPTARLSWTINDTNVAWAAASRAVRVPSRLERDLNVTISPGVVFTGNSNLDSEEVIAYEIGYRTQLAESISVDVATFYNLYNQLETAEGFSLGNKGEGDTYGGGMALTWQPLDYWQLKGSYSLLKMQLRVDSDSLDPPTAASDLRGTNPTNAFSLQSSLIFSSHWQFVCDVRYVESLPTYDVPSYIVGDANLMYRVTENFELAVVGQNLFQSHHFEFGPTTSATEVQQGVYGKATWRF